MKNEVTIKKNDFGKKLGDEGGCHILPAAGGVALPQGETVGGEVLPGSAPNETSGIRTGRIAAYARVSTQKQEKDETIGSQVAAVREYLRKKGAELPDGHIFIDEGFSGSTLVRPGLDRLRDAIAMEGYDTVVVYDPDRLARSYVYQMLLVEEAKHRHCGFEFVRRPIGTSPDEQLLLQMQGVIAEYERAKIAERTRRGKLHKMREGKLVTAKRTFGYDYHPAAGDVPAHFELIEEEAETVRRIYSWYTDEGLTLRQIADRLGKSGVPPVKGRHWHASSLGHILRNSMYTGTGYAHRSESVEPKRASLKTIYRRYGKTSSRDRPRQEWIPFHCPAIIGEETFELAQERIEHNKQLAARRTAREYLLRGLIVCPECGRRMSIDGRAMKYSCSYTRKSMVEKNGGSVCSNKVRFPVGELDRLVWDELQKIFKKPSNLKLYYKKHSGSIVPKVTSGAAKLEEKKSCFNEQIHRIHNLFVRGLIGEKEHLERYSALKDKIHAVQLQLDKSKKDRLDDSEIAKMFSSFSEFSKTVKSQLLNAGFSVKRFIAEQVVRCVSLSENKVVIEFSAPLRKCTLRTLIADY